MAHTGRSRGSASSWRQSAQAQGHRYPSGKVQPGKGADFTPARMGISGESDLEK